MLRPLLSILFMLLGAVACPGFKDRCDSNRDCLPLRVCADNHHCANAGVLAVGDAATGVGLDGSNVGSGSSSSTPTWPDAAIWDAGLLDAAAAPDAGARPDAAGSRDASAVDAAAPEDGGGVGDLDAGTCPCAAGLACVYAQCLPGCVEDSTCAPNGPCDTSQTHWCACPAGQQPCGAACCVVVPHTLAATVRFDGGHTLVGSGVAVAVDGQGLVHVAWYEESYPNQHGTLWYARETPPGWHQEVVDEGVLTGTDPCLALDAQGNPHVAYGSETLLKYATPGPNGAFQLDTVDSEAAGHCSLAVVGTPGVDLRVYLTSAWIALWYFEGGLGHWSARESIEDCCAKDPSLALNPQGVPMVAWFDAEQGSYALKFAQRTAINAWTTTILETQFPCGSQPLGCSPDPSLAVESTGRPVLVYHDSKVGNLKLMTRDAQPDAGPNVFVWHRMTVDDSATQNVGFYPQLRLNAWDDPVVAYARETASSVSVGLARYRNGGFQMSLMDQGRGAVGVGACSSSWQSACLGLALGPNSEAVLAYHDLDEDSVVVIR